jgi:hypothetical protein
MRVLSALCLSITLITPIGPTGCDKLPLSSKNSKSSNPKKDESKQKKTPRKITKEEKKEAKELRIVKDPTEYERETFQNEVRSMFEVEDFKSLQALAKDLFKSKERFPDGSWKLSAFYSGLENRPDFSDESYAADAEIHKKWRKQFPNSPTQLTAFAGLLSSYAWQAKKTSREDTVNTNVTEKMQERLSAARKNLQLAIETGNEDIHWYIVALKIGLGQGWSKKEFDSIVEIAKEKEPEYYAVYQNRALSLLPKWYGKKGDMEKFAKTIANDLEEHGDEAYASIATNIYGFYSNIFEETTMEWDRVKNGLIKSMEKYPNAITLQNHAAYLATLASDNTFAKECFDRLGNKYVKSVWKKPDRFVHFRTRARTGK